MKKKKIEGLLLALSAIYQINPSNTAVKQTAKLSNATEAEWGQRDEGSLSEPNTDGTNPQNKLI